MRRSWALALAGLLLMTMAVVATPVAADDQGAAALADAVEVAQDHYDGVATVVTDAYTSTHNAVTHVYLRQTVDGTPVDGTEATVNVQDGRVVHAVDRFVDDVESAAGGSVLVPVEQAVATVMAEVAPDDEDATAGTLPVEPELVYRLLPDGRVRLAWRVQLETEHHWWNAYVDAEDGSVLRRTDFVDSEDAAHLAASTARHEHADDLAEALRTVDGVDLLDPDAPTNTPVVTPDPVRDGSAYNVFPMPLESPLDGNRRIVDNPADALASPFGWHDTDGVLGAESTLTEGNNVVAYADTLAGPAPAVAAGGVDLTNSNAPDPLSQPDGGDGLEFDFPLLSFDATPATYRDAAVTNLFYWNNLMHDVTFRYGFDEAAGNFQQTNHTGLGEGGDPVLAEAQDGSFVLNANFATPEDGRSGRMQMFLWVDAFRALGGEVDRVPGTQVRDGDVDAGVIAHEYGHGISNRLVGGPSTVDCLRSHDERQGEGWSDWWSFAMTMREGDDGVTPRGIGNYVIYYDDEGREGPGIRITPYSTDLGVNPTTYDTIRTAAEPHGVGYVWATYLWDLYWNLVDVHGFNANPYEAWDTGGNNLAMQLVIDGMKFAPCEPSFTEARDAIIAADAALTGGPGRSARGEGENFCLIWETFARRGLGLSADAGDPADKTDGVEADDVPEGCTTPA